MHADVGNSGLPIFSESLRQHVYLSIFVILNSHDFSTINPWNMLSMLSMCVWLIIFMAELVVAPPLILTGETSTPEIFIAEIAAPGFANCRCWMWDRGSGMFRSKRLP